jgi:hypothetical protein
MAKTGGRSRRPLPPAVEVDLKRIGFVYREQLSDGLSDFIWQHKHYPSIELLVARANLPGSQDLVWTLSGHGAQPRYTSEDEMIRQLEAVVEFKRDPNVFIRKAVADA